MKNNEFDIIVVGSGTSAYYAITGLKEDTSLNIALVDERPYGGTCALRGCQPKKYLLSNATTVAMVSQLAGRGLEGQVRSNWKALQNLKNEFLEGRSEADQAHWQKAGIATFNGTARMIADDQIEVGGQTLTGKKIILATGSLPTQVSIEGSEFVHDSEHFLNMSSLPQRILFIGGGYISFEFAHVAAHGGASEVTIIHRSSQPLKSFDSDVTQIVMEASSASGIDMVLNTTVNGITKEGDVYIVECSSGKTYVADLVIGAIGRHANLSVLEKGFGNVDHTSKGITVNKHLQSVSNPRVYAIGDCADTPYMLAPVADKEGQTVAKNILHGNSHFVDYDGIPSAVFTIPSLGSVGLTEEAARKKEKNFRVNHGFTTAWPSSKRIGEQHGAYKVIIDNDTDLIIGAHIARHNAAEVINTFALAMKFKIKASELADFMWAYPTYTSDLKYMVS